MTKTFSITQFRQYFPATQQQDKTIFLNSAAIALKPKSKLYGPIGLGICIDLKQVRQILPECWRSTLL
ncbi:hypothetical protein [Arsenophonus sp.]|uniref:hypothetical protein n=1 Tax=Arsenophonus sp. TaxID=1872640 RepID=UPI002864AC4D|nr:hypothetical protein [Arsenophonus sp.]MDR5616434.1 hypothetical protein [Arsenophonus sp.]